MPRLRKMRRKQKYQYNVNRKKLNQKLNKLPRINCDAVRNAWDDRKSMSDNLTAMGLVADPNKPAKKLNRPDAGTSQGPAFHVVDEVERKAREDFIKKKSKPHPIPNEMAKKLFSMLDKHGEDYEAMALDPLNFYQETAAQFKSQVEKLKKIPQQWIPYLEKRGILTDEDRQIVLELDE